MNNKINSTTSLLQHIAFIMDGNGRWAKQRHLSRSEGHYAGINNLKKLIEYHFMHFNIPYLSIYAFSIDNWKRNEFEISNLFNYLKEFYQDLDTQFNQMQIGVRFSGKKERVPSNILDLMNKIQKQTEQYQEKILNICFNYTGQEEILFALKQIINDVQDGKLAVKDVDQSSFSSYFYHSDLPPIDLLIRTSGEFRISNFMLWHLAYSEFFFTPIYFPDFSIQDYEQAINEFSKRKRRFGGYDGGKAIC